MTSAPSTKKRFWMMPLTCGRTSAIWNPTCGRASSVVYRHLLRGHDLHGHFHGGEPPTDWAPVFFVLAAHEGQAARSPANKVTPNRKAAVHASPTYNLTLRLSARFNHHAPIENTSHLLSSQVACIVYKNELDRVSSIRSSAILPERMTVKMEKHTARKYSSPIRRASGKPDPPQHP